MSDFLDLPTLIIIGVAVFVLYRLRSVLGTRTGNERPPMSDISESRQERNNARAARPVEDEDDTVVVPLRPNASTSGGPNEEDDRAARKFEAELDRYVADNAPLRQTLLEIGQVDPGFSPKRFIGGATAAYEMILTAFNSGDRGTLRNLLDKDVYDGFESAIKQREQAGETVDFTFVGLPEIRFVDAELDKKTASITMKFTAEIVSATRNSAGELIEGDAERVVNIADQWTFARAVKSRDPNWKLVATDQLD